MNISTEVWPYKSSSTLTLFVTLLLVVAVASCAPTHLGKYSRLNPPSQGVTPNQPSLSDPISHQDSRRKLQSSQTAHANQKQASIYALSKQTFRFSVEDNLVWSAAIDVLMRNYNLTIVNIGAGIITTEWDSFYQDDTVFRNKVSVRIVKKAWNKSDFTIVNNVERLRDGSKGSFSSVWLPSPDENGESARIIQNMALVLKQPPPIFPPGMQLAKSIVRAHEEPTPR